MENKFKEGEVVIAFSTPSRKLVIKRYDSRIYYCEVKEDPTFRELVYFERELMRSK